MVFHSLTYKFWWSGESSINDITVDGQEEDKPPKLPQCHKTSVSTDYYSMTLESVLVDRTENVLISSF